jgi:hypothetical protein
MSTSNNASPFQIPRRVEGELDRNDSFKALRQQLGRRERESDMLRLVRLVAEGLFRLIITLFGASF